MLRHVPRGGKGEPSVEFVASMDGWVSGWVVGWMDLNHCFPGAGEKVSRGQASRVD